MRPSPASRQNCTFCQSRDLPANVKICLQARQSHTVALLGVVVRFVLCRVDVCFELWSVELVLLTRILCKILRQLQCLCVL